MRKIEEVFSKANAVIEEFSRHSFVDKENFSFLVNVDFQWVEELIERMEKLNFNIKCKIEMQKTVTLVFQNNKILLAKQR